MDLLVPGVGELIGGSQREERFDVLAAKVRSCSRRVREEDGKATETPKARGRLSGLRPEERYRERKANSHGGRNAHTVEQPWHGGIHRATTRRHGRDGRA